MTLLKKESLRDVEDLFDRYTMSLPWPFSRTPSGVSGMTVGEWHPRVDICETSTGYEVRADIPGVRKEDLHVTLHDGVLSIQGERHQEKKEDSERMHRVERLYGQFSRSFHLPEDADASAMAATAGDGLLKVTIPRKGPMSSGEPLSIPVQ